MNFTSPVFLSLVLPACLLAFALRSAALRNSYLLALSYGFYGWWDARFLLLLLLASLSAWGAARGIARARQRGGRGKPLLLATLVVQLGILGAFKYYDFFAGSLQEVCAALGLQLSLPMLEVLLPVGISFYTFQALSYVIDVYRGEVSARRSALPVMLFVSFFPQLVAGPIERSGHLMPQLESPRRFDAQLARQGLCLIAWGLCKKLCIADNCAPYVQAIYGMEAGHEPFSGEVLIATYAYALQIYCDFSAYTDIARGAAGLLGIELIKNFKAPYLAASCREFWQRWHISLSQWIRDYVYIPMGGNRGTPRRVAGTLLLTMVLAGLWHGANWTFVVWGGLHGGYLCLERALPGLRRLPRALGILLTFHAVCLAWVFFRAPDLAGALRMLGALASFDGWGNGLQVLPALGLFAAVILCSYLAVPGYRHLARAQPPALRGTAFALAALLPPLLLSLTWVLGADEVPDFIYFRF